MLLKFTTLWWKENDKNDKIVDDLIDSTLSKQPIFNIKVAVKFINLNQSYKLKYQSCSLNNQSCSLKNQSWSKFAVLVYGIDMSQSCSLNIWYGYESIYLNNHLLPLATF